MLDSRTKNTSSSLADLFNFMHDFILENVCKNISGKNVSFEILSFLHFYFDTLARNAGNTDPSFRTELVKIVRSFMDNYDVKKWNYREYLYQAAYNDELQVKGNWSILNYPDLFMSQLLDSPYYKPWLVLGDLLRSPLSADDYANICDIDEDYTNFESRWYSGFCCIEEMIADSCLFHPATIDLTPHEYHLAVAYRHQSPEIQEAVIRLLTQNNRA